MKRLFTTFGLLVLGATTLGADCNNNTPIGSRPVPVLESVAIEADTTTVAVGETVIFTATGTFHQEATPDEPYEEDITALVFWDVSDPSVLVVSPDGRAAAKATGSVTVTAKTPDDGSQVQGSGLESDPITVTVN